MRLPEKIEYCNKKKYGDHVAALTGQLRFGFDSRRFFKRRSF